ncbi:MAG: hypothetical protein DMF91_06460 [Acidobacteria bacterium]|nr:MAG: hypothetical protein DMF91_06460 [Acidobacteriota bacterium]
MLGISIGTAAQMRGAIQWGWLQTLGDEAGDVKLVTACILAASFPALRAARIDPIVRVRRFLRNRSQRRSRPFRRGESLSAGLHRYGLRYL